MIKKEWNGKQIAEKVAQAELKALATIGAFAEGEAKRLATDLGIVDTGRLRSSITNKVDTSKRSATFGTNVVYAEFQEFGTRYQAPRPFLRPVLFMKDKILDVISDTIKAAMDEP